MFAHSRVLSASTILVAALCWLPQARLSLPHLANCLSGGHTTPCIKQITGERNSADRIQILVHGEKGNMTRLRSKLLSFNAQKAVPTKIYSPANCEELRIPFKTDKIAKVVGKLASIAPPLP